jgi:hypothetical protein
MPDAWSKFFGFGCGDKKAAAVSATESLEGFCVDVKFFLSERTAFIRYFFEQASGPFEETMRKIQAGEAPWEPKTYDDSDGVGPEYELEYQDAKAGFEVVGQTCISMLSEAIKAFFVGHERDLGADFEKAVGDEDEFNKIFSKGFLKGYQKLYARFFHVNWSRCPADLKLLEQIVLARNDSQHARGITQFRATHSAKNLRRFPEPFFISEDEKRYRSVTEHKEWLIDPTVSVSRDQLLHAIREVEKLGEWFQSDNVSDPPLVGREVTVLPTSIRS